MVNAATRVPRPPPIEVKVKRTDGSPVLTPLCHSAPLSASQSTASDLSPLSPTSSSATTTRLSSTNSSVTSSPLAFEQLDLHASVTSAKRAAPALPDVLEHPLELDSASASLRNSLECFSQAQASCTNSPLCLESAWDNLSQGLFPMPPAVAQRADVPDDMWDGFNSEAEAYREPSPKRRRSGVSALDSISNRVITRLPSLTRRKSRKSYFNSRSEGNSGLSSPVGPRSRSTSRARSLSIFRRPDATDMDTDDVQGARVSERITTINEDEVNDVDMQSLTPFRPMEVGQNPGELEAIERVQTPLLSMMVDVDMPSQSISPLLEHAEVMDPVFGDSGYDSTGSVQATPQLSAKTSMSILHTSSRHSESCGVPMTPDVSILSSLETEWSDRLGHANFSIRPQPYLPAVCTGETCTEFLADWKTARIEYSKHLARTSKLFGNASKTYRLTEEKWAAIESVWKQYHGQMRSRAAMEGDFLCSSPEEPAPVVRIPSLDDKFPQLSDYEIVGAMERIDPPHRTASQVTRVPSKKNGFMKLIGLDKRTRSASGPR